MDTIATKMRHIAEAQMHAPEDHEILLRPHEAFPMCFSSSPDVLLHLVASIGSGHHRDVAVAVAVQVMYIPETGIAAMCVGVGEVDPDLEGLCASIPTAQEPNLSYLPSGSTLAASEPAGSDYGNGLNQCDCDKCLGGTGTSVCSR